MIGNREAEIGGKTAYRKWVESEGIPVIRDFYIRDIRTVPCAPWDRMGGAGVYLNLIGTGDSNDAYICEIPAGASLTPQRHLFEEMIYVVQGRGTTTVWNDGRQKVTVAWHEGSLFSPPLNTWYQHSNSSGRESARFFAVTTAPLVINLFHNLDFVFRNPCAFTDRFSGDPEYFSGEGRWYPGRVWDSNCVPDVRSLPLKEWTERGALGQNVLLELSENSLAAHISEFPVGTYKKAHRHGPGAHVTIVGGKGYSLMWPEGFPIQRFEWREGTVIVPPERWFHQHFNTGPTPARYLALRNNSQKFRVHKKVGADVSVREGGSQIEYADEDPQMRKMFEEALAKEAIPSRMGSLTK